PLSVSVRLTMSLRRAARPTGYVGGPPRGPAGFPATGAATCPARPVTGGFVVGSEEKVTAADEGVSMAQEVRGVIAPGKDEPVRVETIVVPDPGPGEAVVKVQACGVCHTDLHYKQGGINDDFPFLLGHEAPGGVQAV